MSWYTRIGEKKGQPVIIWESVVMDGRIFATVAVEDIVCAYLKAGYTPAEILRVPEIRFFYQATHQKKVRKILERRKAFRKRSHEWFQKQLDTQT